ncbi:haloalkane dehalogenase [Paraburkholderia sediminicola]|uniref:haloalkane dehalogenase n=1 Tax=Paraburkholderia sediminicola TaxID=458836 RepID=UPI0038BDA407
MTLDALRTPDGCFENLPDFPYEPCYVDDLPGYEGLRMAYLDEGPRAASHTFLCLHGEPTWSYLYRKMIPVFAGSGARVIAPDLFGFGRSDKPVKVEDYTFHFHRNALLRLVERLDLRNITLVCQDWGGLLGLTLPVDTGFADRIARLLVMNTTIAVGRSPSDGFLAWRDYNRANPDLAVGRLLKRSTGVLSESEVAAYDAPFPDVRYKAGVRAFPELVMTDPAMPGVAEGLKAVRFWSTSWSGPTFMAIGATDPVLGLPVMDELRGVVRGCPEPMIVAHGGHFIPEWGGPIARAALKAFA